MATVSFFPSSVREKHSTKSLVKNSWTTKENLFLYLSLAILLTGLLAALFPGIFTSRDPLAADPMASHLPPSAEHLAGTDILGRDVYTRIIFGARYSLLIGIGATLVSVLLGGLIGLTSGVGFKWLDKALMRVVDVVASFPEVLLALLLITFTGRGTINLILALGVAGLPKYARILRSQVQVVKGAGYVEQAVTYGISKHRNVLRHVAPNSLGVLPVVATIGLGSAIIASAGLSFLGLGPQPPAAEWGLMLSESRNYLRHAWWGAVFPGVALTVVVIAATVFGRQLQKRFERRTR